MSTNKSRTYYKPKWCSLNSRYLTGLRDVSMTTSFKLSQCFCSCAPWPLKSMLEEYGIEHAFVPLDGGNWLEVHYDDCPNAENGIFRRYVTKEEHEEYRKIYSR